jgi:2-methylcitrate dehydratase PrpD
MARNDARLTDHLNVSANVSAVPALARLVSAAAGLEWSRVPERLRAHAALVLADTIGAVLAGAEHREVSALARDISGGSSTVLVPGLPRSTPTDAAFINGTAGTFLELDEACPPFSHPAIHVLPAALAVAEDLGRSGAELMTAFVAGYEVVVRLFDAYRMPYPVHPHGHLGAVGAAVAVAMLRRADPVEPALIAASLPILATWDPCLDGSTVRNTWAGIASETGIRANRLSEAGFTGSPTAQDTAFGTLIGTLAEPDALTRPVDPERLRIGTNYFKFHSACAGTHPALDAALALGPIDAEHVESILVETAPQNWKLNGRSQGNDLSNRFSIPYAVAAAIVHGHTGPAAFATEPRVMRLAELVEVRAAPDLDSPSTDRMPARVTVVVSGRTETASVEQPYGHPARPASAERLREKFRAIVRLRGKDPLYERLLAVEECADVSGLFARE